MKIIGIYKIESKLKPERIYIGSAIDITQRWRNHLSTLRKNKHGSIKLQRHVNKYGITDLIFTIIEPCFPEFLTIKEQHYIDTLKPYFNILPIAESWLGHHHTEESRKKMCQSQKGNKNALDKHHSEETKKILSEYSKGNKNCLGRKLSEETKRKMSESAKNKPPISEETRQKLINLWKGRKHSEKTKEKMKESWKLRKLKFA